MPDSAQPAPAEREWPRAERDVRTSPARGPSYLSSFVGYEAALTATAASYAVWHHLGSVPHGFGAAAGGTRIADWIDLLTPYAVLTPALLAQVATAPSTSRWIWFLVGSWLYADGHGIHLAANSVGNSQGLVDPAGTAHLWDEYVGHYLWFAGVGVIATVLASMMTTQVRPRRAWPWLLAASVGLTWATNAIGGNATAPGLVVALVASAWGGRHRADLGAVLMAAGGSAVVVLVGHLALGLG